jgi:hypothetical protein
MFDIYCFRGAVDKNHFTYQHFLDDLASILVTFLQDFEKASPTKQVLWILKFGLDPFMDCGRCMLINLTSKLFHQLESLYARFTAIISEDDLDERSLAVYPPHRPDLMTLFRNILQADTQRIQPEMHLLLGFL